MREEKEAKKKAAADEQERVRRERAALKEATAAEATEQERVRRDKAASQAAATEARVRQLAAEQQREEEEAERARIIASEESHLSGWALRQEVDYKRHLTSDLRSRDRSWKGARPSTLFNRAIQANDPTTRAFNDRVDKWKKNTLPALIEEERKRYRASREGVT